MIQTNFLKEKIKKGEPVIGTWNTIGSPLVTEILAYSNFDFLIVDFEHGLFQLDKIHEYVNCCESNSCSPIIRIPSNSDWMALQVLDQGGHGVMVPHIDDKKSALDLINSVKYFPAGQRGFTPFSKAGGFSNQKGTEYAAKANDFTLTAIIIESKEALKNLDEILELENIDIVYFGAYDLSQALGVPGEVKHPKLVQEITKGIKKVNKTGKYAGGFVAQSEDDIKWLLDIDIRFVTYEVDCNILYKPAQKIVSFFKKERCK